MIGLLEIGTAILFALLVTLVSIIAIIFGVEIFKNSSKILDRLVGVLFVIIGCFLLVGMFHRILTTYLF